MDESSPPMTLRQNVLLKSKSSDTPRKHEGTSKKVTRSHGEVPLKMTKKRGIYVEQSAKNAVGISRKPISPGPRQQVQTPAPPPRPKSSAFMSTALSILSKSTTATQHPEKASYRTIKERRPKKVDPVDTDSVIEEMQDTFDQNPVDSDESVTTDRKQSQKYRRSKAKPGGFKEFKKELNKPKKFRSAVLRGIHNNPHIRDNDDRPLVVLQHKKSLVQTPSMYSNLSGAEMGLKTPAQILESMEQTYYDSTAESLETAGDLNDEDTAFNRFNAYLDTTVDAYNVNTRKNHTVGFNETPIKHTIQEALAEITSNVDGTDKHNAYERYDNIQNFYKNQHDYKDFTNTFDEYQKKYTEKRADNDNAYKNKFEIKDDEALHPIYDEFYYDDDIYRVRNKRKPKPKAKKGGDASKQNKKAMMLETKNRLINMFKEQLSATINYSEPTNIFQALKRMSKNRIKAQEKRLSFVEPQKRDKWGTPVSNRTRRQNFERYRAMRDERYRVLRDERKVREFDSGTEINEEEESYHSLMVFDLDYEDSKMYDDKARNAAEDEHYTQRFDRSERLIH